MSTANWRQGEHRNCQNHRNPESAAEICSHRRMVMSGMAVPYVAMFRVAMRHVAHIGMSVLPMTPLLKGMLIHLIACTAPRDLRLRERTWMPNSPNFKWGEANLMSMGLT